MIPFKADKELARKRIAICVECVHFKPKTRTCGTPVIGDKVGDTRTCGCFMDAKTKISFSRCPLDKWEFLQVTENDYIAIKKLLDEVKNSINPKQKEVLFSLHAKYFGGKMKMSNCAPCIKRTLDEMKQIVQEYEK
tara:strand:- start:31 stop:438 length:408 start_codon:yes stop_codon:yes gene_type:complete